MVMKVANRSAVELALESLDVPLRKTERSASWETNRAHVYATKGGGRRYPPKQSISLATGMPVSEFSGGEECND